MTLGFYKDNQELFRSCVMWFQGYNQTNLGFPILPEAVTVTPNGSFTTTSLGNNKSVVNFDGSTNYISLTDNDAWACFDANFTIAMWVKFSSIASIRRLIGQYTDSSNYWQITWNNSLNQFTTNGMISGTSNFSYTCPHTAAADTWYHFVLQRSGSSCLMYINSISQTVTTTQAFRNTTNVAAPLAIGLASESLYSGNIKDLMIFKGRTLTQAEIKNVMVKTHPVTGDPYFYPLYSGIRGIA